MTYWVGHSLIPRSEGRATKWQLKVPGMGGAAATGCATYRVPSGTSRAKSEGVFPAQASIPGIQLVAGRTGPNAAGIMPKVHDMLRTLLPLCWELQLPFGLLGIPMTKKNNSIDHNRIELRITLSTSAGDWSVFAEISGLK